MTSTLEIDEFIDEDEINSKSDEYNNLELKMKKTKSNFVQKTNVKLESQNSLDHLGHKESSEMLLQLLKERESFKEKLRLAKRAIVVRDEQLERMKSQGNILPLDMTNARLHLAFLFSSPLIRNINGKIENIMQLDYLSEVEDIVKV